MASSRQQLQHTYTLSNDDCFILYGDSIIQQFFSPYNTFAFGAALADVYARKLDVVNRGLCGYNTLQALRTLSMSLPHPEKAQVKFLLLMFGANDARISNPYGGQMLRRTAANTALYAQAVRDLGEETGVPVSYAGTRRT
ncbi:hypothetical protein LTR01_008863 [Friedmanniomyces endolithicus]|nr:hypothetical protein LTR01_008863 [Friedmanniomyces endolithicus]KAK0822983.1 hypothetical protein LTR73_008875 [Friedmanniomyces endolithicus]